MTDEQVVHWMPARTAGPLSIDEQTLILVQYVEKAYHLKAQNHRFPPHRMRSIDSTSSFQHNLNTFRYPNLYMTISVISSA